jgi:phosphatidylglycerophosphatase A
MLRIAKIVSTVFGIGYIKKGGGTVAALAVVILFLLIAKRPPGNLALATIWLLVFFAGVWSAQMVERIWGPDPSRVVIDEIFGMGLSLFLLPLTWRYILAAFILFRFFDIRKPLLIRRAEKLPGGWGVMADDLLAGLYSNLLLQLVVIINLW